jgi:hypothetical protein
MSFTQSHGPVLELFGRTTTSKVVRADYYSPIMLHPAGTILG